MIDVLLGAVLVVQILLLVMQFSRKAPTADLSGALAQVKEDLGQLVQSEIRRLREDNLQQSKLIREELGGNFTRMTQTLQTGFTTMSTQLSQTLVQALEQQGNQQKNLLDAFSKQLNALTEVNERKLDGVRNVVEERLIRLQEDNSKKLEQMRQTVDEKLNATLEQRLAQSFKQVSERLEAVHKGLGEMQSLAANVGDLRRVLTNVKTRGTFGEVQLEMLLEQMLSPEQYDKNVATKRGSAERVEFAVKLPGREDSKQIVYLPIDCKFPMEDYQRMLDAQDAGDSQAFNDAAKALLTRIKSEAKSIHDKYINPPNTTDFAIMYLPIEGLFAEVLRVSGLMESIQKDYRVIISGPTTLTALLNSLQMGFRTLAIQKRSSEVWELLGAIKTQFGTFGELLQKTQKKLQEASNSIETATKRTRTIERKLRQVEELPASQAELLLPELSARDEELEYEEIP
ncbi:DNA recombination protein RmuC [Alicyclobacillus contaminans]|uniref:DNA recombination protein RmuC n=1 Tax=Alicyclobacillus contaminans TaxID=392016 RepID=UPI000409CE52|nr:DNA recombination protein RmuC [Alicyclobacillus contaminans]GMA50697.1 DNA recombination protein RmuC [Alicyclobacillus contaminans]